MKLPGNGRQVIPGFDLVGLLAATATGRCLGRACRGSHRSGGNLGHVQLLSDAERPGIDRGICLFQGFYRQAWIIFDNRSKGIAFNDGILRGRRLRSGRRSRRRRRRSVRLRHRDWWGRNVGGRCICFRGRIIIGQLWSWSGAVVLGSTCVVFATALNQQYNENHYAETNGKENRDSEPHSRFIFLLQKRALGKKRIGIIHYVWRFGVLSGLRLNLVGCSPRAFPSKNHEAKNLCFCCCSISDSA